VKMSWTCFIIKPRNIRARTTIDTVSRGKLIKDTFPAPM
jgi:hypothetical protein